MKSIKILLVIVLFALITLVYLISGQGSLTDKPTKRVGEMCEAVKSEVQETESTIEKGAETAKETAASEIAQTGEVAEDLGSKAKDGMEEVSEDTKEKIQDTGETISEAFQ